jgi:hypothetical protein
VGMRAAFTQQADSITKSCLQGGTSFVCDYGLRGLLAMNEVVYRILYTDAVLDLYLAHSRDQPVSRIV